MEEMKLGSSFLLNLPTEINEEIFEYLTLSTRKNLRLTCKRLYELCNSDRFCRNEKIIWSTDLIHHMKSDLVHLGRSYYNLWIKDKEIEKTSILPFFEKFGTNIRSLDIDDYYFQPGLLESIIMLCENLSSLCLNLKFTEMNSSSYDFTFEPLVITHPHLTHLMITLPPKTPYDFFHRIFTIFPNVKRLQIVEPLDLKYLVYRVGGSEYTKEILAIFDDIMKSAGNLERLEFHMWKYYQFNGRKSEFFEALPSLKYLTIKCCSEFGELGLPDEIEEWYPCCSNLVSVKLDGLDVFCPSAMIRLLTNTGLKYLSVKTWALDFNEESFKKLVASQLERIDFSVDDVISGIPTTVLHYPPEANTTVKYLFLKSRKICPQSTFIRYFRGLVHLTTTPVTDSILQSIFKDQENLRSLELGECQDCSINGFCGLQQDGSEYSINTLQKLEHLVITRIRPEVIKSDDFIRAFSFPRLKYLHIENDGFATKLRYAEIPIVLYENLTELRALRLKDLAMPSRETLPSLLRSLQYLSYLRYDMIHSKEEDTNSVTFISGNCGDFSTTAKEFEYNYTLGHTYYNKELDRMVILNTGLERKLSMPKIGTCKINWIEA